MGPKKMTLIGFFATSVRCEKNMGNSREVGSRQWAVGSWMLNCLLLTAYCLLSCSGTDAKFQQYYVQGEELYIKHCSNCHQKSGKGLGLVYPPLGPSDYMEKNFDDVLCQMKYGRKGFLSVNGKDFNQPMPGVRSLTELEIAEVATYIYNTWGHDRGMVEVA